MRRKRWLKTLVAAFLLAAAVEPGYAQAQNVAPGPAVKNQAEIRHQFADMIQQAIKHSTFSMPGGGSATTVPLLSMDDYEKARQLGDSATSVLAEYLKSKQFFEQLLAIRLLGVIGTDASKDALDDFAEKADLIATRSYALDFVSASGRPKDTALIEKIAQADPDVHMRSRAIDVLQRYKKEHNLE